MTIHRIADKIKTPGLFQCIQGAIEALRWYQNGHVGPDLAESVANALEAVAQRHTALIERDQFKRFVRHGTNPLPPWRNCSIHGDERQWVSWGKGEHENVTSYVHINSLGHLTAYEAYDERRMVTKEAWVNLRPQAMRQLAMVLLLEAEHVEAVEVGNAQK